MYDIVVIGGGHAGSEAAHAAATMGSKVLLISMDMTKIAQMSCNPAMGGIAKGQIVREIDALGGMSGIITDKSMIQFRMLNRSKGPAMWSPRAQCDRVKFSKEWRESLEKNPNIDFWQDIVNGLIIKQNRIIGVKTKLGIEFYAKTVILTIGTFENGLIHVGQTKLSGGRISEPCSTGISDQLKEKGFNVGRLKTGTPVRIDGRTVNFTILEEQKGDEEGGKFSFLTKEKIKTNFSCYITFTNEKVHDILREGFDNSPLFNGSIKSIGPRYCPSIESKILTFPGKSFHQLFLEPEGENTCEYYLNGFSSSLPWDVQFKALKEIKGFENVKIFRPGYAIEYDYFQPTQLNANLETQRIKNLFFAGQINGTTGYEEAAGQGIIAGINAHLCCNGGKDFVLDRDESYIGVLIDDLITKGVDEPYRMFTSRAEYRILLRQDNCDERLTERAYEIGIASSERKKILERKLKAKTLIKKVLEEYSIDPKKCNGFLESKGTEKLKQKVRAIELIKRSEISIKELVQYTNELNSMIYRNEYISEEAIESLENEIKYGGYIQREKLLAEKVKRLEKLEISKNINYLKLNSISTEGRQKLNKIKPKTIGQASRIPGVSPSDISVLLVHIGR